MATPRTGRPRGRPKATPENPAKRWKEAPWPKVPFRVWSGGQTGVDRAALDAADLLGLPMGGYCPKTRRAEDGPLDPKYPLREIGYGYKYRTMMNVLKSHGTLVVWPNGKGREQKSYGTTMTVGLAMKYAKPHMQVSLKHENLQGLSTVVVATWIVDNIIPLGGILNVAGPRESDEGGEYKATKDFLVEVFKLVKEKL